MHTRHKFEIFCLFSLNSIYLFNLIQNQVRYFQYVYNCVFSIHYKQIPTVTLLQPTLTAKKSAKITFLADNFGWVSKDYKYAKFRNMIYMHFKRLMKTSIISMESWHWIKLFEDNLLKVPITSVGIYKYVKFPQKL